jgi:hypothetical protein
MRDASAHACHALCVRQAGVPASAVHVASVDYIVSLTVQLSDLTQVSDTQATALQNVRACDT